MKIDFLYQPYIQGIVAIITSLLLLFFYPARNKEQIINCGFVGFAIYQIFNPFLMLLSNEKGWYFLHSILMAVLLFIAIFKLTKLAQKIRKKQGSQEATMIYLTLFIYYPVLWILAFLVNLFT